MGRTKLYVGNLPENCPVSDLQALFEPHGKVEECDVVKNYGFVHITTEDEAKTVIETLNNFEFMGSKITVEISHSKVRQKPGMGGKGQCYRCGRQGHWSKECLKNPNARMAYKYRMHPMYFPGYGDRPMPRYGGRFVERLYGQRFAPDRMRPYMDPYERRHGPPPPPIPRDDYYYYYYRRPYEEYGNAPHASPPPPISGPAPVAPASVSRPPETYNTTDETTFE